MSQSMPSKKSKSQPEVAPYQNIYGWSGIDEVAQDVWSSGEYGLLEGNFVFAYQGTGELGKLIVTSRTDGNYIVSMVTPGWTMYLPNAPKSYIEGDIVREMKTRKVENGIIENLLKSI